MRNAIERAVARICYERIVLRLPDKSRTYRKAHLLIGSDNPLNSPYGRGGARYIHHLLTAVGGNKTWLPAFWV